MSEHDKAPYGLWGFCIYLYFNGLPCYLIKNKILELLEFCFELEIEVERFIDIQENFHRKIHNRLVAISERFYE